MGAPAVTRHLPYAVYLPEWLEWLVVLEARGDKDLGMRIRGPHSEVEAIAWAQELTRWPA